jgi:hypothetical protein
MNPMQDIASEFARRLSKPTAKLEEALAKKPERREDERKRPGRDDQAGGSRRLEDR